MGKHKASIGISTLLPGLHKHNLTMSQLCALNQPSPKVLRFNRSILMVFKLSFQFVHNIATTFGCHFQMKYKLPGSTFLLGLLLSL